jgi:hypothetical protein
MWAYATPMSSSKIVCLCNRHPHASWSVHLLLMRVERTPLVRSNMFSVYRTPHKIASLCGGRVADRRACRRVVRCVLRMKFIPITRMQHSCRIAHLKSPACYPFPTVVSAAIQTICTDDHGKRLFHRITVDPLAVSMPRSCCKNPAHCTELACP